MKMENEQLTQLAISQNLPTEIEVPSGKKFKIRPITNGVLDRMSGYMVKQEEINTMETAELIAKLRPNLKLQSKAVAMGLLNDPRLKGFAGWFKISFFFWFYWRYIFMSLNSSDITALFSEMVDKMFLVFFYQNMALTKGMNSLEKKKTKEEVGLSQVEQELEKKQDS